MAGMASCGGRDTAARGAPLAIMRQAAGCTAE